MESKKGEGIDGCWIIRKSKRATVARFSMAVAPWWRETHNLCALLPRYMTFQDANDEDYTLLPSDPSYAPRNLPPSGNRTHRQKVVCSDLL